MWARTTVQYRTGKFPKIVRTGEETSVTGDATHAMGRRILDFAPAKHAVLTIGGNDTVAFAGRRIERGIGHSERDKDVRCRIIVERFTAHASHDLSQNDKVDVAVKKTGARLDNRMIGGDHGKRTVMAGPVRACFDIGPQARSVGQELPDRDGSFAGRGKFRPVPRDGLVQTQRAGFRKLHDGSGRHDDLGERSEIEYGVDPHGRNVGLGGDEPECLAINDPAVRTDKDHCARHMVCRDLAADDIPDRVRRSPGATCASRQEQTEEPAADSAAEAARTAPPYVLRGFQSIHPSEPNSVAPRI